MLQLSEGKLKRIFLLLILLAFCKVDAQNSIYYANIEGDIDLGLAPYVRRVIKEAEKNFAQAIIFRINTFGGRVDAATQIKDAILNSKITTVAFVDKRAISAGALITLSCEKIVMVPGASMGASTVVDQAGQKQSEKYQSYMRSEMRATAEKNKRRTDIAQGMVDEKIIVPDLQDDSTKLITLTSEEALKYGMADTVLTSMSAVQEYLNLEEADMITLESNWSEDLVRFINNPIISSLLIMIGLIGLYTEIKTPGWGLPGTAGVIALALFFGTGYILEIASVLEIILFVVGVALLLVELFFIPGFGIFGIAGIVLMIGSLFLGLLGDFKMLEMESIYFAIIQLGSTFVATVITAYLLSKILPKTEMWNKMILNDNIVAKSGYASVPDLSHLIGVEGTAFTDLRPSGTAMLNGQRIDVVSEGNFINRDSSIYVKAIEGSKVVVDVKK